VIFYADLQQDAEYRMEISGPREHPVLRLVKRTGRDTIVLAATSVQIPDRDPHLRFSVEAVNLAHETRLRARLEDETSHREWQLEVSDTQEPLRGGSVGAWSDDSKTLWDDFLVEEIPGLESGISGDQDGDGICDSDECPEGSEVCLDEEYDSKTRLSDWVVDAGGKRGHSGQSACGNKHSYWISKRTGFLVAETPELAGGLFRFQLLLERRKPHPLRVRVVFSNQQTHEISAGPASPGHDFAWSDPVMVNLPSGVSRFRIESVEHEPVHVEGFRLEPECER